MLSNKVDDVLLEEPTINAEHFWAKVSRLQDDVSQNMLFPLLSNLAFTMLSLPVSNAAVERVFSSVNLIKTKLRNKLSTEDVAKLIFVKQSLKGDCTSFEPSDEILKHFNFHMYDNEAVTNLNSESDS